MKNNDPAQIEPPTKFPYPSDEEINNLLREHQKEERAEKRRYLLLKFFPAIWCLENRFFRATPHFDAVPKFERDRARWLEKSSWQNLIRVTEGRFKWLAFAPPVLLALSYAVEAGSRLGIRFDLKWNIILTGINALFYFLLYLWLRAFAPPAVRTNLSNRLHKWHPVSRTDSVRVLLAGALQYEVVTIRLTAKHLPSLNHALEEEVLGHHFATTGKDWPYEGLDQDAMNMVRALGAAVAKVRGGTAYEIWDERGGRDEWSVCQGPIEYIYPAKGGPRLYMVQISTNEWRGNIKEFRKDVDVCLEFHPLGRNFLTVDSGLRTEYFIQGYDRLVDESSADVVLDIIARSESCKKPVLRVAAWVLFFITFMLSLILSGYQIWQSIQRISAFSN